MRIILLESTSKACLTASGRSHSNNRKQRHWPNVHEEAGLQNDTLYIQMYRENTA